MKTQKEIAARVAEIKIALEDLSKKELSTVTREEAENYSTELSLLAVFSKALDLEDLLNKKIK